MEEKCCSVVVRQDNWSNDSPRCRPGLVAAGGKKKLRKGTGA